MELSLIAAFVLHFSLCAASWVVPRDLEDGVYHVTLPHDGEHDDGGNATGHVALFKRLPPLDERFEVLVPDPDINQPDEEKKGRESFRRLPAHEVAGDHGEKGMVPFSAHDCIFNEPTLLEDAYNEARASLFAYCNRWKLPPKTAHIAVSKRGDVIAYACSWHKRAKVCSRREFVWAESKFLDGKCGPLTPGWVSSDPLRRTYGRGWVGSTVCKRDIYDKNTMRVTRHVWVGLPPDMDDTHNVPDQDAEGVDWDWDQTHA